MFDDLPQTLLEGDRLVLNDTKVIPARLDGRRKGTGGAVEVFLLKRLGTGRWKVLVRPGRQARPGTVLEFGQGLSAEVRLNPGNGRAVVDFSPRDSAGDLLAVLGKVPLPPYIKKPPDPLDSERYQTVYARNGEAVAAPTAGLHFTVEMLARLEAMGVGNSPLTLNVGPGTFEPLRKEVIGDNRLDPEEYHVPAQTLDDLRQTRRRGGSIIAVGTTTARVLESLDFHEPGGVSGETSLFIFPPYRFRNLDGLITNFHLPGSSLLALVAAFAGLDPVMDAYREAVSLGYRFYSYGDAMLIK